MLLSQSRSFPAGETEEQSLTFILKVPRRFLYGVAVGGGDGGRGRGEIGGDATHRHGPPVSVRGVRVEGAELRVFRDDGALEGAPVQVVPGVAGDAGRVGDGPDGDPGRDVRVDVPADLGVRVGPAEEGVPRPALVLLRPALPAPGAGPARHDEDEDQDGDARHEDDDSHRLLQADVPGRGYELVADVGFELAEAPAGSPGSSCSCRSRSCSRTGPRCRTGSSDTRPRRRGT